MLNPGMVDDLDPMVVWRRAIRSVKGLSDKAKQDLTYQARNKKPNTAGELWWYIKYFFNFEMPHKACCPNHQTPFDMVWCLYKNIYSEFAVLGSRASFKTLSLAVSEALDLIFGDSSIIHIGAIDKQAQKCYSYVKKFLIPMFVDMVRESLMIRTVLNNGNVLEIIPCTLQQVNGPHESKVRWDEVEIAQKLAYEESKGIPVSNSRTGEPPSIVYTSTRKFVSGLFGGELKRLRRQGKPVLTFCYKDVTRRCEDSRSGKVPAVVFVNKETFQWSKTQLNKDMHPFMVFDKCFNCSLIATCTGDLKRSNGIIPINDAETRFGSATPEFWIAQGECRRPMRKGLMIYNFDEQLNVAKIDWKMFLDRGGRFDEDNWYFVAGKDFNYNPDATLLAMINKNSDKIYFIKEFNFSMKTLPDITREIVNWCTSTPFGLPIDIQCDKSEPGLIATMKAFGLEAAMAVEESDVEGGCDLLNYLCRPPNKEPLFYVDSVLCPTFVWELSAGYIRKLDPKTNEPGDEPLAKNNHYVDCARYICWKYLRKYARAYGVYDGETQANALKINESMSRSLDQDIRVGRQDPAVYSHILMEG